MQIDAVSDCLSVHVGRTFNTIELEKLRDAFAAFAPFSRLDIDFAEARHCDDSALARLASALMTLDRGVVRVRGLTVRQWRLLTCAGLDASRH